MIQIMSQTMSYNDLITLNKCLTYILVTIVIQGNQIDLIAIAFGNMV
jgi:hypothetical protein